MSQPFTFTTNFPLTTARYGLLSFSSSNSAVATITKNASYPPTLTPVGAGTCDIITVFPGDSQYGPATITTPVTVQGTEMEVFGEIVEEDWEYDYDAAYLSSEDYAAGNGAQIPKNLSTNITLGYDGDSDGEFDGPLNGYFIFYLDLYIEPTGYTYNGQMQLSLVNNQQSSGWLTALIDDSANQSLPPNHKRIAIHVSTPGNVGGTPTAGVLNVTLPPSGAFLGWSHTFNIKLVNTSSPYFQVLASGLNSQAGGPFVPIEGAIYLNENDEFNPDWSNSATCCPHEIYLKGVGTSGTGGAFPSGQITATILNSSAAGIATFAGGVTQVVRPQNQQFSLFVNFAGSFSISFSVAGASQFNQTVSFTVAKINTGANISVTTDPSGVCCDPEPDDCPDITLLRDADDSNDTTISLEMYPSGLAWNGLSSSAINTSISNSAGVIRSKVQESNGYTLMKIGPGSPGFGVFTATYPGNSKYNSFTISKSIRTRKPYLVAQFTGQRNTGSGGFVYSCPSSITVGSQIAGHTVRLWATSCSNDPSAPKSALDDSLLIPLVVGHSQTKGFIIPYTIKFSYPLLGIAATSTNIAQEFTKPLGVYGGTPYECQESLVELGYTCNCMCLFNPFDPGNSFDLPKRRYNTLFNSNGWGFHVMFYTTGNVINCLSEYIGGFAKGTLQKLGITGINFTSVTNPTIGQNLSIWTSPDFPYKEGYLGEYFNISGSSIGMSWARNEPTPLLPLGAADDGQQFVMANYSGCSSIFGEPYFSTSPTMALKSIALPAGTVV